MKILHKDTNEILFSDDSETMKETLENAVKQGV